MKIRSINQVILPVLLIFLTSCVKNSSSSQSGVIEKYMDDTYYFKIIDYKEIRENDNTRYKYPTDTQEGCVICRARCNPENNDQISIDNVDKICNLDVKIIDCFELGFGKKNKAYNHDKELLQKDTLIKNEGDKVIWYEYFEELNNIFDTEFENDELEVCSNKSTGIVIFDTSWEEVVSSSIYKLQNQNTYYHATDGKIYSSLNEANSYCSKLKDKELKWRLISGSEFDLVNEKKMAVKINYRMNIGIGQCFFTSDGGIKTFSDDKTIKENCQKGNQGRVICVSDNDK